MAAQAVAGRPSWSHVFPVHVTPAAEPPGQYVPAGHGVHTGSPSEDPLAVCCEPAGQSDQARQTDWFSSLVYNPDAHATHSRSVFAEGSFAT
jgi:hypothetical protein